MKIRKVPYGRRLWDNLGATGCYIMTQKFDYMLRPQFRVWNNKYLTNDITDIATNCRKPYLFIVNFIPQHKSYTFRIWFPRVSCYLYFRQWFGPFWAWSTFQIQMGLEHSYVFVFEKSKRSIQMMLYFQMQFFWETSSYGTLKPDLKYLRFSFCFRWTSLLPAVCWYHKEIMVISI